MNSPPLSPCVQCHATGHARLKREQRHGLECLQPQRDLAHSGQVRKTWPAVQLGAIRGGELLPAHTLPRRRNVTNMSCSRSLVGVTPPMATRGDVTSQKENARSAPPPVGVKRTPHTRQASWRFARDQDATGIFWLLFKDTPVRIRGTRSVNEMREEDASAARAGRRRAGILMLR